MEVERLSDGLQGVVHVAMGGEEEALQVHVAPEGRLRVRHKVQTHRILKTLLRRGNRNYGDTEIEDLDN